MGRLSSWSADGERREKVEKAEAQGINMNFLFDGFHRRLHFRRLAESRFMEERERESERPSLKGQARNNGVPA